MKQPERCTGVESGGCTEREYWNDPSPPIQFKNGNYWYRGYDVILSPSRVLGAPDWSFCHEDYEGTPSSRDIRCGFSDTASECFKSIDELEDE